MLVSEAVADTLVRLGVDTAFGLLGVGNFGIVEHLTRVGGADYYAARHETAAVAMADGFARVGGRVGVCTVTQGPGLTNALTALTEAVKGRTPLLLVTGDSPARPAHDNQVIDQRAFVQATGAVTEEVGGPDSVVADVARAFHRASTGRRPVVLSVPLDVQALDAVPGPLPAPPAPVVPGPVDAAVVEQVAALLAVAQRPVIVAGRGAVLAGAGPVLEALGERVGALLLTSAVAKGLFTGDPFDLGICGGFSTHLAARLVGQADVILAFGAGLNRWTTGEGRRFPPAATVVHCDVDPEAIGAVTAVDIPVVADAAVAAAALVAALDRRGVRSEGFRSPAVTAEVAAHRHEDEFQEQSTDHVVDPRTCLLALDRLLPAERTVAVDSGHFQGFPALYLSVPDAAGFLFAQAFMSVGLGVAGAAGAAVARPDRLTVAVVGDGGMLMSLGELDTLVRLHLPVLVVVVNDAAYGAEIHHMDLSGVPNDLAFFQDRDFAAVARAMGAGGVTVRATGDLEGLRPWLAAPQGPMLVDCKVNPAVRASWFDEVFGSH